MTSMVLAPALHFPVHKKVQRTFVHLPTNLHPTEGCQKNLWSTSTPIPKEFQAAQSETGPGESETGPGEGKV